MASDRTKAKAEAAMQKKYPQMYDSQGKLKKKYRKKKKNWVDRLKAKVKKVNSKRSARSKDVERQTGLSEKELQRLR